MKPSFSLSILGCMISSLGLGCGDGGAPATDTPMEVERSALAWGDGPAQPGPDAFVLEKIGDPLWEPVDFHLMTVDLRPHSGIVTFLQQFLPPPQHVWINALGIGPGAPHPPPYDDELEHNIADLGFKEGSIFSTAEADWPNVLSMLHMVVPSAGAPIGSSPDFEEGPIIPHTIFPITVALDYYEHGPGGPPGSYSFDVPALDEIDPPFLVEGHSHFPIFSLLYGTIPPGRHFINQTMTDNEGNGWVIHRSYVLQETPTP